MSATLHPEFSLEAEQLQKTLDALDGKIKRIEQRGKTGGDAHATNALIELEQNFKLHTSGLVGNELTQHHGLAVTNAHSRLPITPLFFSLYDKIPPPCLFSISAGS